ncbi:hypothetical protein F2Q70_00042455 [Brassica cretica]|uniref:Uncharacterized protein n=1 Tax=Brassica cretica TaxID=69181 RepID=A0A8S9KKG1_BRACR|nr:hypothetical protein F2Q70_00042455 [Brassica cretica]
MYSVVVKGSVTTRPAHSEPRLTALEGTDPNPSHVRPSRPYIPAWHDPNPSPWEETPPHPPVGYWCAWRNSNPRPHPLTTLLQDEFSPIDLQVLVSGTGCHRIVERLLTLPTPLI